VETTFFNTFGSCKTAPRKPVRTKPGVSRPNFSFQFAGNWTFSRSSSPTLRLAHNYSGIEFDADLMSLAKQARRPLTRIEADFIWLVLAVYLADRCAPRYPYGINAPAHWRRRIHVGLPVSDPARWEAARDSLMHVLDFLTEDDWSIEFQDGRAEFDAEKQRHFPEMRAPDVEWTALFSGGLDSLAGALQWLAGTRGNCLLVSGQTHNRITVGQQLLVTGLREGFPGRIEHLGFSYGFPDKRRVELSGLESSQRSRAFIHTALGALAALMAGTSQLFLFENGFGAFNLPCDSAQFGSMNSRGTHPMFLRRMATFVRAVFSQPFVIANPFTFSTKGQMLSATSVQRYTLLLPNSFSCDLFPNYHHRQTQCGTCPSCLVRRLAFHCAGLADDSHNYSTDVFHPRRPLRASQWLSIAKLSVQAESLAACLRLKEPWPALCAQWPDLLRAEMELPSAGYRDGVIALLSRHVDEWRSFSTRIQSYSLPLAA
jgi:Queuosine biosynthesis protein QueC